MTDENHGLLYVVATPIGNLADIGKRALSVLAEVDLIAAEDTRTTGRLLQEYAIRTRLQAYHEHNEEREAPRLAESIRQGARVALVSDAGTPLVSDPGYRLVSEVRRLGLPVVPVPGPSALIAALSASGLPSDRFLFAGFPPRGSAKRRSWLESLVQEPGTLILYESSHRVRETLVDLCTVFDRSRRVVLARELTKLHETFLSGYACDLIGILDADANQARGEHVLLIEGAGQGGTQPLVDSQRLLELLLEDLPVKRAAALAAKISGERKNELYKLALRISGRE